MRTSLKIKGTLAVAGLTYQEFADLCGLSRQTIHTYLNDQYTHMEDCEGGVKAIDIATDLMGLCLDGKLPLKKDVPKEDRVKTVKELLKPD